MSQSRSSKKFDEGIDKTSTPNYVTMPKGRPSIHHETPSIILNGNFSNNSESEEDEDSLQDNYSDIYKIHSELETNSYNNQFPTDNLQMPKVSYNPPIHLKNEERNAYMRTYSFIVCIAIVSIIGWVFNVLEPKTIETAPITTEELHVKFPSQLEYTWDAVVGGIEESAMHDKPSVFLFLYENKAKKTIECFLSDVAKYASCTLKKNCQLPPITLTNTDLDTVRARTDYGYVIEKYKPILEERGVMIVKNLDKIPGQVAQAFHSMCDEYTPLVSESVFFFTMQIDNLKMSYEGNESDEQLVKDILRKNWDDLDDDIFYPLFTRITSMILRIVPEKF